MADSPSQTIRDSVNSTLKKVTGKSIEDIGCTLTFPPRKEYPGPVGEFKNLAGSIVYTVPSFDPKVQGGTLWSTANIIRESVLGAASLMRGEEIGDPTKNKLASQLAPYLSLFKIEAIEDLTPFTIMALIQSARREQECVQLAETVEGRESGTVSRVHDNTLQPLLAGEPIDIRRVFESPRIKEVLEDLEGQRTDPAEMYVHPKSKEMPPVSIIPVPIEPESNFQTVGMFRSKSDPRISEKAGTRLIQQVHRAILDARVSLNIYGLASSQQIESTEMPPPEFMAAMALKESSWNPFIKGGVGERGMYQLRPATAKELWNEAGGIPTSIISMANSFVDNLPSEYEMKLSQAGIQLKKVSSNSKFNADYLYNPVINTYLATLNNVKNIRWATQLDHNDNPLIMDLTNSMRRKFKVSASHQVANQPLPKFIAFTCAYNGGRFSLESAKDRNPSPQRRGNLTTYALFMYEHTEKYKEKMPELLK